MSDETGTDVPETELERYARALRDIVKQLDRSMVRNAYVVNARNVAQAALDGFVDWEMLT